MFNLIIAICSIISTFLMLVLTPIFAKKYRLNLWKQPLSHFYDRQDTVLDFEIIMWLFVLCETIISIVIINKLKIDANLAIFLLVSVVSGFIPPFFPFKKFPNVHNITSFIFMFGAFFSCLITNYYVYTTVSKIIGGFSFVMVPSTMFAFIIYFFYRRYKSKIQPLNAIGEYVIIIPMIIWNFLLCLI